MNSSWQWKTLLLNRRKRSMNIKNTFRKTVLYLKNFRLTNPRVMYQMEQQVCAFLQIYRNYKAYPHLSEACHPFGTWKESQVSLTLSVKLVYFEQKLYPLGESNCVQGATKKRLEVHFYGRTVTRKQRNTKPKNWVQWEATIIRWKLLR